MNRTDLFAKVFEAGHQQHELRREQLDLDVANLCATHAQRPLSTEHKALTSEDRSAERNEEPNENNDAL